MTAKKKRVFKKVFLTFLVFVGLALLIIIKIDYRLLFEIGRNTPKLERPINKEAIEIISQNKNAIKQTAKNYGVNEIAIAGIILAEMSLDPGPIDKWEESRIKNKYLKKTPEELEKILENTENDIGEKVEKGENEHEFLFKFNRPLTWSIGVCQITPIRARKIENKLAKRHQRTPKNIKEVIKSLLNPNLNIEYCGQELYDINQDYLQYAKIDISQKSHILGTLFNTGNSKEKAKKYIDNPNKKPEPNDFGKYIELHAEFISKILNNEELESIQNNR